MLLRSARMHWCQKTRRLCEKQQDGQAFKLVEKRSGCPRSYALARALGITRCKHTKQAHERKAAHGIRTVLLSIRHRICERDRLGNDSDRVVHFLLSSYCTTNRLFTLNERTGKRPFWTGTNARDQLDTFTVKDLRLFLQSGRSYCSLRPWNSKKTGVNMNIRIATYDRKNAFYYLRERAFSQHGLCLDHIQMRFHLNFYHTNQIAILLWTRRIRDLSLYARCSESARRRVKNSIQVSPGFDSKCGW